MEEKTPIAAAHHGESEADDERPVWSRNSCEIQSRLEMGAGIEQNGGDLGVGRAFKPAIKRTQREDEPAAPFGRERARGRGLACVRQRAPQAQCGGGTDVEELSKRRSTATGAPTLFSR